MKTSLDSSNLPKAALERLAVANAAYVHAFPGEPGRRQPVHTVYGGAQLFSAQTPKRISELALASFDEYAKEVSTFARAFGLADDGLARTVHARVRSKLEREALEDFRIDFEDGYGNRADAEEDGHAVKAAEEVALAMKQGGLPPFIGIRIKTFSEELHKRSIRTLDLFVTTLVEKAGGKLPEGFVVTLPKIIAVEQVEAFVACLDALEAATGLAKGAIPIELMVETTQSIFYPDGSVALPRLVRAAQGRCTGAHFGTYDYTASCNITAAHQHMLHPACDFAKQVMKVSLAGMPVFLSDGATTVMPVGPHRAPKEGPALNAAELAENARVVHNAWKLAYDANRHSLIHGFYQGWDLHPAQLPARYAALYTFFLEGLESAGLRLKTFVDKAAQATLVGDVFDDAATGQGLLNYFLRGINCGAITAEEAQQKTGLTLAELQTRSFLRILAGRKG